MHFLDSSRRRRACGFLAALALPVLCAASLWAVTRLGSIPRDLRRPDPALLVVTDSLRRPRDPGASTFADHVDDLMHGRPNGDFYPDLQIDHPSIDAWTPLLEWYTPDHHIYGQVTSGWTPDLPLTSCRRDWLGAHADFIEQLIALAEAGYPAWSPGQLAELSDEALAWLPSPRSPLLVDSEYILVLECRRRLDAADEAGAARCLAALDRLAIPYTSAPEIASIRAGVAHRLRGARMLDCWLRSSPPSAGAAQYLLDVLPPAIDSLREMRFILECTWRADRATVIACCDRGLPQIFNAECNDLRPSPAAGGALRRALALKTGARQSIERFDADWRSIFSAVDSGAPVADLTFPPAPVQPACLEKLDPAAVGLLARELDQLSALHRANIASLTRLAAD